MVIFDVFQLLAVGFGTHNPSRLLQLSSAQIAGLGCSGTSLLLGWPLLTQSLSKRCRTAPAMTKNSMNLSRVFLTGLTETGP